LGTDIDNKALLSSYIQLAVLQTSELLQTLKAEITNICLQPLLK